MALFAAAIGGLLLSEGSGYVPNDKGRGPSKFGITLATYKQWHPNADANDIAALTPMSSASFYEVAYWERFRLGEISSQRVANKMLDIIPNVELAVLWLQEAAGVKADGIVGPKTIAAVNSTPEDELLAKFQAAGEMYYTHLAASNPEKFGAELPGWLNRIRKQV